MLLIVGNSLLDIPLKHTDVYTLLDDGSQDGACEYWIVAPCLLDLHHHTDLDDLVGGNVEERTRALGVAAENDEEPFSPQRHTRLRCRNGVYTTEKEGRPLKIHLKSL